MQSSDGTAVLESSGTFSVYRTSVNKTVTGNCHKTITYVLRRVVRFIMFHETFVNSCHFSANFIQYIACKLSQ